MSKDNVCPECKGKKEIIHRIGNGLSCIWVKCPICHGTGKAESKQEEKTQPSFSLGHRGKQPKINSIKSYWKIKYTKEYQSKRDIEIELGKQQSIIDDLNEKLNKIKKLMTGWEHERIYFKDYDRLRKIADVIDT